ncbi:LysR family transcriptional regulator [Photobacterium lipolyticum]|nr:LysR family transcriptional regulator [Photobacterium lipolyticum]
MDFNQVRYFLALADTLNFTRAAEQCYVSQPALTQAIKRLEVELGGELFLRDGRYTEITELGKSLRGYFEQIDRTRHLVRTTAKAVTSGEIAELNIGVMCTIGPWLITAMLDTFQIQHPMVSIVLHDVTPESIPSLLLSGALDGAFCAHHNSPHSQLRYVELFEEAMVVAFPLGHAFAKMDAVPLRAIAKQRYVDRLHCEFRQEMIEFYDRHDLQQDVAFRSQREDWIQSMVRDGMGVSVIPRFSLLHTEIDHRPIIDPPLSRRVEFAVVNQTEIPPALDELIEHATKYDWSVSKLS